MIRYFILSVLIGLIQVAWWLTKAAVCLVLAVPLTLYFIGSYIIENNRVRRS